MMKAMQPNPFKLQISSNSIRHFKRHGSSKLVLTIRYSTIQRHSWRFITNLQTPKRLETAVEFEHVDAPTGILGGIGWDMTGIPRIPHASDGTDGAVDS